MTLRQSIMLTLQVSIVLTVFAYGLQATVADVLGVLRRPALLTRALVAMFMVMPLVAVALSNAFELRPAVEIMLIALAIAPIPPLLPGKARKQGGEAAFGLGLMAIVGVLSIAIVPLGVYLLGRYFARPFAMPAAGIARVVLVAAILPLAAGMIVRAASPKVADVLARPAGIVATVLLAAGALPVVAGTLPAWLALVGSGTVVAMVAFAATGLAAGHVMGGPNAGDRVVVALAPASRHPAIAFAIAKANFPDEAYLGATVLLYLLVNVLVAIPYLSWRRTHAPGDPAVAGVRRS